MYFKFQLFKLLKADSMNLSASPASKRTLKPSTTTALPPQQSTATAPAHAPAMSAPSQSSSEAFSSGHQQTQSTPTAVNSRKRRLSGQPVTPSPIAPAPSTVAPAGAEPSPATAPAPAQEMPGPPPAKKGRTNTPWTPGEEQRLKQMRDAGNSWSEIAKV